MIHEEVEENFVDDYHTIPPEEWIDLLGTLEARYERRGASSEAYTTSSKKIRLISLKGLMLTVSQSLGLLSRNKSLIPERVNKIIPLAISAPSAIMSSARRQGTLSAGTSITLVKITNDFYYYNTKKYLDGHLAKNGAKVKQLCNTYNNMLNQMEAPKKQNKMLFKLAKKKTPPGA